MQPFDIQNQTRFIFGEGAISQLGQLAAQYRPQCVLVVSDRGIMEAGHDAAALKSLEDAGLTVASFQRFWRESNLCNGRRGCPAGSRSQTRFVGRFGWWQQHGLL